MKKSFVDRIIREGSVDTRKYRYIVRAVYTLTEQYGVIERLPLNYLDTTAALHGWETVARV